MRPKSPEPKHADAHEVRRLRWYHTIDLPGDLATPGEFDLRGISRRLPWPESMDGMRCLDVGSRDGFYAFEMERRGAAEVVSVDVVDPADIDFPGSRPPDAEIESELAAGERAFEFARAALGSRVARRHQSAYGLSPELHGEFDFAVIGTLLLHLRDPARALAKVRSVVSGRLLVNEPVIPGPASLRRRPVTEVLTGEGPFWSVPNPAALRRMVEAAGFEVIATGRPYLIPIGAEIPRIPLRRCLAGPVRELPRMLLIRRGSVHAWVLGRSA